MLIVCAGGSPARGGGFPAARDSGVGGGAGAAVAGGGGCSASLLSDGSWRRAGRGRCTWSCSTVSTRLTELEDCSYN